MRRRYRWLIGTTAAAAVITPVAYVGWAVYSWDGGPIPVGCSKVMAFAGGSMPAQATGAKCTDDGSLQEAGYTAEFRMPQEDLAARLVAAFPRVRQDTGSAIGLRFSNEPNDPHPHGQASDLQLRASYEADGTALVELRAFDI
ncbi:hypothetical protein [Kitasatospora sp. SUK 42]|uniref:hypothetical protein n=1 Tax=Kitasatospora sp. SUK 42 TaxID=1588882 RepID=UPI0018CA6312|nr:hypothetical protein [Kitasatospora sp. SUK 42]MBV2154266.1 hypothetical protein [Kitasatospora sp. SUK 42]